MSSSKSTKSAAFKILILGIIYKEDTYGYDIIDQMKLLSSGQIQMKEGTLYPILKSLSKKEFLRASWKKSPNGKSRKYYGITERGKAEYKRHKQEWEFLNTIIHSL